MAPRHVFSMLSAIAATVLIAGDFCRAAQPIDADVCVYGATPCGILAAAAVKRGGYSVVIVEPSRWVGGMLGAGLKPTQDCPNLHATGGMTRKLLTALGQPDGNDMVAARRRTMSQLDPGDIRRDFRRLLKQRGVRVVFEHRVASCAMDGAAVESVTLDRAPFDATGCPVAEPEEKAAFRVSSRVFIDASYEGDLMARAGVSYRVGREAADEFGEARAGVRTPTKVTPIDPFVEPGHSGSGLLRWVEEDHGKPVGAADGYTQAYNYRYYTTDDPAHRVPITRPAEYDPQEFELVGRYVAHLVETIPDKRRLYDRLERIFPGWKNSGEWNYHRDSLFSMAPLGISQLYADGDYAMKARVWKQHQEYLRGLHHFMSSDPRVPEAFRREVASLGLDRRPHPDTQGWPHQLYIRVSRRMIGRYTITAHDVYNRTEVEDPIGLAQYGIDTYPARRIWLRRGGRVLVGLEGEMFVGGARGPTNVPYAIPYRAITPKIAECTNLLVPVCFSATHLGYASARMEPVFMMCGESAGIAACRALAEDVAVQQIAPDRYRAALEEAGQLLVWTDELARSATASRADKYTYSALLESCDADGDGLVVRAEWIAGKPGYGWLFPIIDTDRDGGIDAPEYAAFQAYKRQNPAWRSRQPTESD